MVDKIHEKLKNHSSIHYLIKTVPSLHNPFDVKTVWNWHLQIILSSLLSRWEHWDAVNWRFFVYFKKGKVYFSKQLTGVLNTDIDFLWHSVDWARNKCLLSAVMGVHIKWVKFRENISWLSPGTKTTAHNNEMSILSGCP